MKIKLDEETKNEIKAPLQSPMQSSRPAMAQEVEPEPYLKPIEFVAPESSVEITAPTNSFTNEVAPQAEQPKLELNWDVKSSVEETEQKITRHVLDDESEPQFEIREVAHKPAHSAEEQHRLAQERLERIQQYTAKLRKTDGISSLETEPAFVRRNIHLDESTPSNESQVSRFSLSGDKDGSTLKSNNSFLHDNVD